MKELYNSKFLFSVKEVNDNDELYIEFTKGSGSDEMISALNTALAPLDPVLELEEDLWMNDEILYHYNSKVGVYQISSDIWGMIFIFFDINQQAIVEIENALLNSGLFEKE